MIKLDLASNTFVCPYCGHAQAYNFEKNYVNNGQYKQYPESGIPKRYHDSSFSVFTMECNNKSCQKISVSAINRFSREQVDILPKVVMRNYPDYIPLQIRNDYYEANLILEDSPKAAATLLRRCLQGMIRDFWGIIKQNLYDEINALEGKISASQWNAIDGLRKIGNIGAHMEKDVDLIVDIDPEEAKILLKLIELLLDKWYITRHEEEEVYSEVSFISNKKETVKRSG